MKIFGWIVFAFGFAVLVFGCSMDTTVSSGDSRVHNLGLLRAQENSIMVGGLALIVGILMVLLGGRSSKSGYLDPKSGLQVIDGGREQIALRDSGGTSGGKKIPKITEAEKYLDNDTYKVYLVEKYEIKINDVLKKYFIDGKLYDTVDLALARAHELETNLGGEPVEWTATSAKDFLQSRGYQVNSKAAGFEIICNGLTSNLATDNELIQYAISKRYTWCM